MTDTQLEVRATTPMELMQAAIEKGLDADTLGKLMDLHLRWEAEQQRKAYIEAMATFRANPPEIKKTKKVQYKDVTYYHAELDKTVELISEALGKVNIRPSWRTSDTGGKITVTCVLTHNLGHSEDVATLQGPPDVTGSKNNVQAIGSTVTYLQRYTLLAGTGLAPEGADDDGKIEGIPSDEIQAACDAMRASVNIGELMEAFKKYHGLAKDFNDRIAMGTFIDVYNDCKKAMAR